MKKNMLRYALLIGMSTLIGTVSCSESKADDPTDKPDDKKLTAIVLQPASLQLVVGQSAALAASPTPQTASLGNLRWTPRNPTIATVDDNGTITAVSEGTGIITAACDGITATCQVTVSAAPVALQKLELSPAGLSLAVGKTADIAATLVPANADVEGAVNWKSNNPAIATVDDKGHVVTLSEGRTEIVASLDGISATCQVNVYSTSAARPFTFLQLNLWEGMSNVDNGRQAVINQLEKLQPDAASFCEFRSLGEAETELKAIADALLASTGIQYYYTCYSGSGTRGLLTRHPVLSKDPVPAVKGGTSSWFYRTIINFYGMEIALYASHAYHLYYACYLPRGYGDGMGTDGWGKLPDGPITDVGYILEREELSGRTEIARDLSADAKAQHEMGRLTIFGGDLNQPSHLDWTNSTKNLFEHNGCVVAWPISTVTHENGLRDAFREIYPDPVTHPGVTWPVHNKDARKDTQWAAEADERDRIDFVYFLPNEHLTVKKAQIVGPEEMIAKSQVVNGIFQDKAEELIEPVGVWPSDHRGLFITFEVKF